MISGLLTLIGFLVFVGVPTQLHEPALVKVPLTIARGLLAFCSWAVFTRKWSENLAAFGAFAILGFTIVALARSSGL